MEYATMSVGKVVSVYLNVSEFGSLQCHTVFEWNMICRSSSKRILHAHCACLYSYKTLEF